MPKAGVRIIVAMIGLGACLGLGCKIELPQLRSALNTAGLAPGNVPAGVVVPDAPVATPPPAPAGRACSQPGTAPDGRALEAGMHGHKAHGSNQIGGAADTVTSDATQTIRVLPNTFHGLNDGFFYDNDYNSAATNQAMSQLGYYTSLPVSGVLMDWFLPLDSAANSTNFQGYQLPINPGMPEAIFGVSKLNGAHQVLWGLNETNNNGNDTSAAGYAKVAKYIKDHGVDVMGFQEGNEPMCNGCGTNIPESQYYTVYENAVSGVHSVYPTMPVFGPAPFNFGSGGWDQGNGNWNDGGWVANFVQHEGNVTGNGMAAGVSFHYYYKQTSDVVAFAADVGKAVADVRELTSANDTRDLDIIISEFGANSGTNKSGNAPTAGYYVSTAMNLAESVREIGLQGLAGYQYFTNHGVVNPYNGTGAGWGIVTGSGEGSPNQPTASYYAFRMMTMMGQRLHPTTQGVSDVKGTLSTYATSRADGSQQIMAINKSGATMKMKFGFKGFDPSGGPVFIHSLAGSSLTAQTAIYNGVSMPATTQLPAPAVDCAQASIYPYTLPPYSITVLDFTGGAP